MDKAVEVDQGGLRGDPHRPGAPGDVPQAHRRLLRLARRRCSSSRPSRCPSRAVVIITPVRPERDAAHREGDPRLRPRREPDQQRQDHPRDDAGAHRGAPQGVHQAGQGQGRGRPGLGPQHPPARQAGAGASAEGRRGRRGRGHRRREAARRHDEEARRRRSTTCSSTRKPSCSRSERLVSRFRSLVMHRPRPAGVPPRTPRRPHRERRQPRRAQPARPRSRPASVLGRRDHRLAWCVCDRHRVHLSSSPRRSRRRSGSWAGASATGGTCAARRAADGRRRRRR